METSHFLPVFPLWAPTYVLCYGPRLRWVGFCITQTLLTCCGCLLLPISVTSFDLKLPPSSLLQQALHQRWAWSGHGFFFIRKNKVFYFFNEKRVREDKVCLWSYHPEMSAMYISAHRFPIFIVNVSIITNVHICIIIYICIYNTHILHLI